MKKIFTILLLSTVFFSCGGIEIQDHKVERLGLLGAMGFNEKWTVTGTIKNSSSSVHRNITLKIEYQDNAGNITGDELLPLDIAISPNSVERFEVKTNHAPEKVERYLLSIESSNTQ